MTGARTGDGAELHPLLGTWEPRLEISLLDRVERRIHEVELTRLQALVPGSWRHMLATKPPCMTLRLYLRGTSLEFPENIFAESDGVRLGDIFDAYRRAIVRPGLDILKHNTEVFITHLDAVFEPEARLMCESQ